MRRVYGEGGVAAEDAISASVEFTHRFDQTWASLSANSAGAVQATDVKESKEKPARLG